MARPHHRKKHKAHLRQFQHKSDIKDNVAKTKASTVFAIIGAVVGLAVFYFATQGNLIWGLVGTVIGAGAGYLLGNSLDHSGKK